MLSKNPKERQRGERSSAETPVSASVAPERLESTVHAVEPRLQRVGASLTHLDTLDDVMKLYLHPRETHLDPLEQRSQLLDEPRPL